MIVQCHITGKFLMPSEVVRVDSEGVQFKCTWCGEWHGWHMQKIRVVPARVLGLAWLRALWGQRRAA